VPLTGIGGLRKSEREENSIVVNLARKTTRRGGAARLGAYTTLGEGVRPKISSKNNGVGIDWILKAVLMTRGLALESLSRGAR